MEIKFGIEPSLVHSFEKTFELKKFIQEDIDKWRDFADKFPKSHEHSIYHHFSNDKNQFIVRNEFNYDNEIQQQFVETTETFFKQITCALFDSQFGRYVQKLIQSEKYEDVNKLINYMKQRVSGQNATTDGLLYELYLLGLDVDFIQNGQSIFSGEIQNLKREQELLESLRDKTKTDFESLEKTYNEKLRLDAPARYWREKFKYHNKRHRNLLGILFVYIAIALIIAFCLHGVFYDSLENAEAFLVDKLENETANETNKLLLHARMFIFTFGSIFVSTLFFWPIRHIVRMLISEDHLRADSKYKDSLLITYLALHKKGAVVQEQDRKIALESIFKQPADGLVKDDAMPSWMPSSWISK